MRNLKTKLKQDAIAFIRNFNDACQYIELNELDNDVYYRLKSRRTIKIERHIIKFARLHVMNRLVNYYSPNLCGMETKQAIYKWIFIQRLNSSRKLPYHNNIVEYEF